MKGISANLGDVKTLNNNYKALTGSDIIDNRWLELSDKANNILLNNPKAAKDAEFVQINKEMQSILVDSAKATLKNTANVVNLKKDYDQSVKEYQKADKAYLALGKAKDVWDIRRAMEDKISKTTPLKLTSEEKGQILAARSKMEQDINWANNNLASFQYKYDSAKQLYKESKGAFADFDRTAYGKDLKNVISKAKDIVNTKPGSWGSPLQKYKSTVNEIVQNAKKRDETVKFRNWESKFENTPQYQKIQKISDDRYEAGKARDAAEFKYKNATQYRNNNQAIIDASKRIWGTKTDDETRNLGIQKQQMWFQKIDKYSKQR